MTLVTLTGGLQKPESESQPSQESAESAESAESQEIQILISLVSSGSAGSAGSKYRRNTVTVTLDTVTQYRAICLQ